MVCDCWELGCQNEVPQTVRLNQQKLSVSRVWRPVPSTWNGPGLLCPHTVVHLCVCVSSSLLMRTLVTLGQGPPIWLRVPLITSLKALSPHKVTF